MALSAGSAIEALVKNPETFLKTNRLGCYLKGAVAKKDLVKLVPAKEKQSYDVQLSDKKGEKDTISAYILGYKASEVNDPLFLDIPTTGVPEGTFFFTAELSGCSVVVTRLKNDTYRVYHDYRVNSAVLYDNVVMSVDWEDYKIPKQLSEHGRLDPAKGRAVGHAVACMQFRDGAWKLFLQRHLQGITKQPNSPNWVLEVQVSVKQSVKKSDGVISEIVKDGVLKTTFESRRSVMKKSVKALATSLKLDAAVIAKAEDGKYGGGGKFDVNDPSIRGWNELRNAIRKELEKQDKAAKGTNPTNFIVGKHTDMLEAAQQFDKIWLWLQIKKAAPSKK